MFAAILAAGCVANRPYDELVGEGRLDLPAETWSAFQAYRGRYAAHTFAVDPKTGRSYYNFCPHIQCEVGDWMRHAVDACSARYGADCKIVGREGRLVWRGPVYVAGRRVAADGALGAAEIDPPQRGRVGVVYRVRGDGGDREPWIAGTVSLGAGAPRRTFDARFEDGLVCSGYLDAPPTATDSLGGVEARCRDIDEPGREMAFAGPYRPTGSRSGSFEAGLDDGRRIEVSFGVAR